VWAGELDRHSESDSGRHCRRMLASWESELFVGVHWHCHLNFTKLKRAPWAPRLAARGRAFLASVRGQGRRRRRCYAASASSGPLAGSGSPSRIHGPWLCSLELTGKIEIRH
jgi:hypothetical protein